jgi:hypothetical protein
LEQNRKKLQVYFSAVGKKERKLREIHRNEFSLLSLPYELLLPRPYYQCAPYNNPSPNMMRIIIVLAEGAAT